MIRTEHDNRRKERIATVTKTPSGSSRKLRKVETKIACLRFGRGTGILSTGAEESREIAIESLQGHEEYI